ncbi:hypothetical protein [Salipiger mucosus]|uniref:Uncharacterized protein n=1 Tax=Salipiger mucosus DSM 16094 TaxID=1123237 RepID=S9QR38_9RHOB|nr:hypothetical protein [Salipiger mucosus]EPX83876.1 hypothetical protein Salmuc_01651 [Salipiger mucosus DSM 16094]
MTPNHLHIDYDEGVPGSYRGVVLTADGKETQRWATGDPQSDWASYLAHAKENGLLILQSSSITHFCWDNPEWRFIEDADGREVLVPEDRPEWLEATDA